MKTITIIGSGSMARGVAIRALAARRAVQVIARSAEKAGSLARELGPGVIPGWLEDDLSGDMIVLAVPYPVALGWMRQNAGRLENRVVVDVTNPVDWESGNGILTPADSSAAEELAKLAPATTSVVKAFKHRLRQDSCHGPCRRRSARRVDRRRRCTGGQHSCCPRRGRRPSSA